MKFYGLRHKSTKIPVGVDFLTDYNTDEGTFEASGYIFEHSDYGPEIDIWLVENYRFPNIILEKIEPYECEGSDYERPEFPKTWYKEDYEIFEVEI